MKKDYAKIFTELQKESIEFNFLTSDKEKAKIGASKFGGNPDIIDGFSWPRYKGVDYHNVEENRALSFLCQINLEEVSKFDKENLLPKKGMLYFFYETITMPWGFDIKDKDSSRVFYYDTDISSLKETPPPNDMHKDCIFPEIKISFKNTVETPHSDEYSDYHEDEDYEEYEEAREDNGFEEIENRSKLLGYGDIIQSSMQLECEAVSRSINMGNGDGWRALSKEEQKDIKERSKEWILLFQLDTVTDEDNDFELMFGDSGRIYFYIRKEDLKNKRFENAWLILQCF